MADAPQSTWDEWIGADVVDEDGNKIGSLTNVYMDRSTGQPEWLAASTGMFGTKSSFVPIAGAGADGDALRVPFAKDLVKDAPNVDEEDGYLEPDEEERLYRHYGQDYEPLADDHIDVSAGDEGGPGHDTSGPTTDSAMTRSEEELQVGTRSVEAGRVRLRKYVVTENVTTTVPVRKERVRIERVPITDENIGDALDGPEISEEEHEVILHEDQVVVSKEAVAKERVRLDTETVVEDQTVTDEVRKERIEVDDDGNQP
jgi:uncharacterized protein (TIGR02271 family)